MGVPGALKPDAVNTASFGTDLVNVQRNMFADPNEGSDRVDLLPVITDNLLVLSLHATDVVVHGKALPLASRLKGGNYIDQVSNR